MSGESRQTFIRSFHDVAALKGIADQLRADLARERSRYEAARKLLASIQVDLIKARHRAPACPFCGYATHLSTCSLLAILTRIEEGLDA